MKKVCGKFMLMLFVMLMFSGLCLSGEKPQAWEPEQVPERVKERQEMAEQMKQMRNRMVELREAAEIAKKEGREEDAIELRQQAKNTAREIEEHQRQNDQRRLREAEGYLEQLRRMTQQAEGILDRLRRDVERREAARMRPERELRLRPMPERFDRERLTEQFRDMGNELRDFLTNYMNRMNGALLEHQMQMELMQRQLQDIFAENRELKNQLRESNQLRRQLERELDQQKEALQRREARLQRQLQQRKEARQQRQAQQQAEKEKVEKSEVQDQPVKEEPNES